MSQESTGIFENSVQEYDAWFDRHLSVYESEIRAVKELVSPSGKDLEGLQRVGDQGGVEPAKAMAALARERRIQVYEAYAEKLPFEDFPSLPDRIRNLPNPWVIQGGGYSIYDLASRGFQRCDEFPGIAVSLHGHNNQLLDYSPMFFLGPLIWLTNRSVPPTPGFTG
jgi:hypothetical protein